MCGATNASLVPFPFPICQEFVDLLALGMTLPGPTSSEFCIAGKLCRKVPVLKEAVIHATALIAQCKESDDVCCRSGIPENLCLCDGLAF
jgi:hypothetical protein